MTRPSLAVRSPWIVGRTLRGEPGVHLYCFAHSGGLASEYVRWAAGLPDTQVYGICPPGRGGRVAEPPPAGMSELVAALVDSTEFVAPFVLFGHSLGALTAFEVARALRERGRRLPDALVVSAYPAPHLERDAPRLHSLPDAELVRAIGGRYGALPPQVADDPELLALLLPAFRTDFAILETYRHRPGEPLPVPLEVCGGLRDDVTAGQLEQWSRHTTGSFGVHRFPGDHFYFREDLPGLLDVLRPVLDRARSAS
jgi:surfactin synthase thioesterase subunit